MEATMATAELNEIVEAASEAKRVTAWRLEQLVQAGYDEASAAELAQRLDIDLHVAEQLPRSGCSTELALQILC